MSTPLLKHPKQNNVVKGPFDNDEWHHTAGLIQELHYVVKELSLTIPAADLNENRKPSDISDLIGEFFSDEPNNLTKNSISSIINELITNGMKYSRKNSDIKINSYIENGTFCVLMENVCSQYQLSYLNKYLTTITGSDKNVQELCIERCMWLSSNKNLKRAQLGLISLINNFGCVLDIQTHKIDGDCLVSTQVTFRGM